MRRAIARNALALLPIVLLPLVTGGCSDSSTPPDSVDAANDSTAVEPAADAQAEGASPEGRTDTHAPGDGMSPDSGGSDVLDAGRGDAVDATVASDAAMASDATVIPDGAPDDVADAALGDAAADVEGDGANGADGGPLVCFDGGRPPSDWPTVYQDLFGPGPDGGPESKGHCARVDCHGGGFGGLFIDPWTPNATYQAFTTQRTFLGILVDLDAGKASASVLGDPAVTPLAWYGGPLATVAGMPRDRSVIDPCAAAEVTAWLGAGAAGPVDAGESDGGLRSDAGGGPGTLTLSLDPSLDTPSDTVLATSIAAAVLLDRTGVALETATLSRGEAVFKLTRVPAGDYFIRINGDGNDLVPTRVDDPAANIAQRVGQKLRASEIGTPASPVYRINTWSSGQGESPVAQFSDGKIIAGLNAYVVLSFTTPRIEFLLLGSATPLTSFSPGRLHPPDGEPFDKWLLVSNASDGGTAPPQHGVTFTAQVADGGAPTCVRCHTGYNVKPAQYSAIAPNNGWCFHCHNGPVGGDANGFVDPTR